MIDSNTQDAHVNCLTHTLFVHFSEIEKGIEGINDLRREKWEVDGHLRQLKCVQAKKYRQAMHERLHPELNDDNTNASNPATPSVSAAGTRGGSKSRTGAGDDDESGAESEEEAPGAVDVREEIDENITQEELASKIENLIKVSKRRKCIGCTIVHAMTDWEIKLACKLVCSPVEAPFLYALVVFLY